MTIRNANTAYEEQKSLVAEYVTQIVDELKKTTTSQYDQSQSTIKDNQAIIQSNTAAINALILELTKNNETEEQNSISSSIHPGPDSTP